MQVGYDGWWLVVGGGCGLEDCRAAGLKTIGLPGCRTGKAVERGFEICLAVQLPKDVFKLILELGCIREIGFVLYFFLEEKGALVEWMEMELVLRLAPKGR